MDLGRKGRGMRLRSSSVGVVLVALTVGCAAQPGTVSRTLPADLAEVTVLRTEIDAEAQTQTVILQEKEARRSLTIYIGLPEASAIQRSLDGETYPRPATHDLAANLTAALGGELERAVIERRENTFIATLVIKQGLSTRLVDARASDALALALRTKSPVFVADALLH